MPPPRTNQESDPLLPTHNTAPLPIPTVTSASYPPRRGSSGSSTSPTASLTPASRGKLQGRRYLSPETLRRPLLSGDGLADGDGDGDGDGVEEGEEGRLESTSGSRKEGKVKGKALSEKAKGKQRATVVTDDEDPGGSRGGVVDKGDSAGTVSEPVDLGRSVTVIFANEGPQGGKVDVWVDEGESVGKVKDKIRHLHPPLSDRSLRLIHSGRLLTDGILLLAWLRSLEERVRRQAAGMGGDVEEVLRGVGVDLGETDTGEGDTGDRAKKERERRNDMNVGMAKVFIHCTVGGVIGVEKQKEEGEGDEEPAAPRRRGFDVLLDAGLSAAEVSQMRRQFYESRGEEVPDGMGRGDQDDEHSRALEEQWIEGDLTADTAATSNEGQYSTILKGLLMGFLYPVIPLFFFREAPLANFFDAEAEAQGAEDIASDRARHGGVGRERGTAVMGQEVVVSSVFEQRVQMGVFIGLFANVVFGVFRFLS